MRWKEKKMFVGTIICGAVGIAAILIIYLPLVAEKKRQEEHQREIEEAKKRHGHWVHIDEGKITDCSNAPVLWKCSYCHTPFVALVDRYHYCPNCGALMDEEVEE